MWLEREENSRTACHQARVVSARQVRAAIERGVVVWLRQEDDTRDVVLAQGFAGLLRRAHDDEDAEPSQDKLRRKGLIQPPGTFCGPPQA